MRAQETRRKGEKPNLYVRWYNSNNNNRNGMRIVLMRNLADRVVVVRKTSDKLMSLKLEVVGDVTKRGRKHFGPTWKKS